MINPEFAEHCNLSEDIRISRLAMNDMRGDTSTEENLEKGKSTIFLIKRGENTLYVGIRIG